MSIKLVMDIPRLHDLLGELSDISEFRVVLRLLESGIDDLVYINSEELKEICIELGITEAKYYILIEKLVMLGILEETVDRGDNIYRVRYDLYDMLPIG